MKEDIKILKKIERFLNAVPNNKYGNNYELSVQLTKVIDRYKRALHLFKTLKKDAEMALDDVWDRRDDGFEFQINAINKLIK